MDNAPNLPAGTRSDSIPALVALGSQNAVMPLSGLPESYFVPIPAVTRILSQFDRAKLGAAIEVMIALLDVADGDSDVEPNGDQEDASWQERPGWGCPQALSEPHEDSEDDDHGGGNVEDEGEHEDGVLSPAFGIDQTGPYLNYPSGREAVPIFECCDIIPRR